jgi:RNA-dependent RNA polymerase
MYVYFYTRSSSIILSVNQEIYPSAYQIRMAGCKGLVIIDPESTMEQFYIKIRPSMKKFKCNDWNLEICDTSQPSIYSNLF